MYGDNFFSYYLMDKILNSIEKKNKIFNQLLIDKLKGETDFEKVYYEKKNDK